jgi:hypothetical protein
MPEVRGVVRIRAPERDSIVFGREDDLKRLPLTFRTITSRSTSLSGRFVPRAHEPNRSTPDTSGFCCSSVMKCVVLRFIVLPVARKRNSYIERRV